MSGLAWHEEPIGKQHDRESFDCGEDALNEFLRRYARKSHELGGAKTFVAIDESDSKAILGFYSLSPASIAYARTPESLTRGLARHEVPAFRLARLARGGKALPVGRGGGRWSRACHRRQKRKGSRLVCKIRGCTPPRRAAIVVVTSEDH